ncbi:hypothetical protein GQ457_08G002120 [Hibiscus cannabinus]
MKDDVGEDEQKKTVKIQLTDYVMMNVDGVVNPSMNATAIGGVCRSDSDGWIFDFRRRIGCCSSLNAKLWAILDGLQFAWRHGYRRVIIESDCREAVWCVNNGGIARMANGLVVVIKEWLLRHWEVQALKDHTINMIFFEEPPDGI